MKFKKSFHVEVELDIEQSLIDGVLTDDWRSQFYRLHTPDDVAHHIAYNVVANSVSDVRILDGFADRKKSDVNVVSIKWDEE